MLVLPVIVLLTIPIILLTIYIQNQKSKTKKNTRCRPPGPKGLPIIGNLHQFDAKYPHIYLWRLAQKYGPIMSLQFGYKKVVVISSADVVKEIMKSHDITFSSRPALAVLQRLSYNGLDIISSPYGEYWKEIRKISSLHLFTWKQVQSYRPIREDEVLRLIKRIEHNSSYCKVNNLSKMMTSMTSNTICRVAFGKSYGDEGYEKNRFSSFLQEAQALAEGFFVADCLPKLGWIDKITGMYGRLEKNFRDLDEFDQGIIDEHLDVANRPKSMEGDLLDILLELRRSYPESLTLDHIKAVLMNILVAGTDTTAATVVWAMTALMKNPTMMKKAQVEVRYSVRNKGFVNENDVLKLPYLAAIVKETLRLYPPSPLLVPRETWQDCNLLGYDIQRGTLVFFNAWAIARDPKTWKNSNDFMPERFLDNDMDIRGRDPELIPFGMGRRGCPGISMGIITVQVVLANLIYKFNWNLPDGMKEEDIDFDVSPGLTMHKKIKLCLMAKSLVEYV